MMLPAFSFTPCYCSSATRPHCSESSKRRRSVPPKDWDGLSLAFVSLDVPSAAGNAGPAALRAHVERELSLQGRPVRWAVVGLGGAGDDAHVKVDAVVSRMKDEERGEEGGIYLDDVEGRLGVADFATSSGGTDEEIVGTPDRLHT